MVADRVVDVAQYPAVLTTLWLGVLNNDAEIETTGTSEDQQTYRIVGDPTEGSLLVAAAKAGALHIEIDKAFLESEGIELALDSVCAALNTALEQADKAMEAEVEKATGGVKLPGVV